MKAQNPEGVLLYTIFIVFLKDGLVLLVAFQSRPHSASQRTTPVHSQASAVTPAHSSDKTPLTSVPMKLEPGSNLRPGSGVRQWHLMLSVFFYSFIYSAIFLSTCYGPGVVLGGLDVVVRRAAVILCPGVCSPVCRSLSLRCPFCKVGIIAPNSGVLQEFKSDHA